MANERHRRLMQEALDQDLTPDTRQELARRLDQEPEAAAQYSRLRRVDQLLRTAPFEQAPARLALSIMARLAEELKTREQLLRVSGLALAVALALVTLVMLPLLAAAAWLFLSAVGSASALAALIHQIAGMLAALAGALDAFVRGAQNLVADSPQTAALLLALVPAAIYWLTRRRGEPTSDDPDAGA